MRQSVPWVVVVAVLSACAPKSATPSAPTDRPDPIPSGTLAAAACAPFEEGLASDRCATGNPRGQAADTPLEWGDAAVGALWRGLLVCPGGAMAVAERTDALGPVATRSPSPRSAAVLDARAATASSKDQVDVWTVRCPEQTPRRWHVTPDRCGNPCPPEGFRVVPFAVADALVAAREAGDLAAVTAARAGWEDVGFSWRVTAATALRAGDPFAFLDAMLALDELRPLEGDELGALGRVAVDLDAPSALQPLRRGLATLDDPSAWALCGVGLAEAKLGDLEVARPLLDAACAGGDKECCPGGRRPW